MEPTGLPLPAWQAEVAPHDEANWSRPEEGEGEEDLECPPPLEPHLQQLLGWEELPLTGAEVEDGLMSMPKDLEPSPLYQADWIQWHTCHVETLTWWRDLLNKVHASFEVPKAHNQAKGVDNYYTPTGPSIHWEISLYATLRCMFWQSGLLASPVTPDPHLHEGTSVLGRGGPTASSWLTSLSGRKCG